MSEQELPVEPLPIHDEIRIAVEAIREQLDVVAGTLRPDESPAVTGRAIINLAPRLIMLGEAMRRLGRT